MDWRDCWGVIKAIQGDSNFSGKYRKIKSFVGIEHQTLKMENAWIASDLRMIFLLSTNSAVAHSIWPSLQRKQVFIFVCYRFSYLQRRSVHRTYDPLEWLSDLSSDQIRIHSWVPKDPSFVCSVNSCEWILCSLYRSATGLSLKLRPSKMLFLRIYFAV